MLCCSCNTDCLKHCGSLGSSGNLFEGQEYLFLSSYFSRSLAYSQQQVFESESKPMGRFRNVGLNAKGWLGSLIFISSNLEAVQSKCMRITNFRTWRCWRGFEIQTLNYLLLGSSLNLSNLICKVGWWVERIKWHAPFPLACNQVIACHQFFLVVNPGYWVRYENKLFFA